MKIEVAEDRSILLKEVFNPVILETEEGNRIGICMRDATFEFFVAPAGSAVTFHRVEMETGLVRIRRQAQPRHNGGGTKSV